MTATTEVTGKQTAGPERAAAELLDVKAVATMLGCSVRHVYRLSDSGQMPRPVRLGSLVRWSKRSISEWIGWGCPRSGKAGAP
jgi:excisionase family DNA binding protein